jgi:hypothetical protein
MLAISVTAALGLLSSALATEPPAPGAVEAAVAAYICADRLWNEHADSGPDAITVAAHQRVVGDIVYLLVHPILLPQQVFAFDGFTFLELFNAAGQPYVFADVSFSPGLADATLHPLGLSDLPASSAETVAFTGLCAKARTVEGSPRLKARMVETLKSTLRHELFGGDNGRAASRSLTPVEAIVGNFSSLDQFTYAYLPSRRTLYQIAFRDTADPSGELGLLHDDYAKREVKESSLIVQRLKLHSFKVSVRPPT